MQVVLLAGGLGTRISEESHLVPKPMIEIGGQPILWHIMKHYSQYGYHEFIICAGYKQHVIKEYFADYYLHRSDVTFDFSEGNSMTIHNNISEPWKVTIVDTGLHSQTGGRLRKIEKYIQGDSFMVSYGDGVSDVDVTALDNFHRSHGKIATISTTNLSQRFGILEVEDDFSVSAFTEKAPDSGGLINIGYMVFSTEIFNYLKDESTVLERSPLEKLSKDNQLMSYKHDGFWKCMDTLREKQTLENLWSTGEAPWKVWLD